MSNKELKTLKETLQPTFTQRLLLILKRNSMPDLNDRIIYYLKTLTTYPDLKFEDKLYLALNDEELSDLHERLRLMYSFAGIVFE